MAGTTAGARQRMGSLLESERIFGALNGRTVLCIGDGVTLKITVLKQVDTSGKLFSSGPDVMVAAA
jgi:hypothetical protein